MKAPVGKLNMTNEQKAEIEKLYQEGSVNHQKFNSGDQPAAKNIISMHQLPVPGHFFRTTNPSVEEREKVGTDKQQPIVDGKWRVAWSSVDGDKKRILFQWYVVSLSFAGLLVNCKQPLQLFQSRPTGSEQT